VHELIATDTRLFTLPGAVFFALGLAACASGVGEGSLVQSATPTESGLVAQDQPSTTPAPTLAAYTPPDFPPNYRMRIAALLVNEYVKDGRGPPEITSLRSNTGLLGASTALCVQFPIDNPGWFQEGKTATRPYLIDAYRGAFTGDKVAFRLSKHRHDRANRECGAATEPFPELEQLGNDMRACRARNQGPCKTFVNLKSGVVAIRIEHSTQSPSSATKAN
jgi:hypothetical protein